MLFRSHQPDLIDHFQGQLKDLSANYNVPIVKEIQTALGEVKPLIGSAQITAASVKKINDITTRLDHGIVTKD